MWHCCWVVLTFFIHTVSPLTGIVALSAWFGCTANVLQTSATVAGLPSSTTLQCLLSECGASPQDAGCGMHPCYPDSHCKHTSGNNPGFASKHEDVSFNPRLPACQSVCCHGHESTLMSGVTKTLAQSADAICECVRGHII
jgi:hypothetical protein